MINKIIIIGGLGQVGSNLKNILGNKAICLNRNELDLAKNNIIEILSQYQTDIIINAAAYTQVDKAEQESELANLINGDSIKIIVEYAKKNNILFVHYSTDYIFSNHNKEITEDQLPNPLSVYGKSKLAGENNIISSGGKYLIIRTSAVYNNHGHNFVKTMLKLGASNKEIKVVEDQITSPTYAFDLAKITIDIINKIDSNFKSSIYNICNNGSVSWYGFASKIFELAKKYKFQLILENIRPISSLEYNSLATRPKYSVLSCNKLYRDYKIIMPNWQNALERCIRKIKEENNEDNSVRF